MLSYKMLSHRMLRIIRYGESKYYRGYNSGATNGLLIGFGIGCIIFRKK